MNRTTTVKSTLSALALAASATLAQAGTLAISPNLTVVNPGDSFTLSVVGTGFAEVVAGGGFNLSFDPTVLQFNAGSSSIGALWEFVPSLGSELVDSASQHTLTDVSFATFVNSPTGNFAVASLGFTALQAGNSTLTLSPSAFFDFSDNAANILTPSFTGGDVVVSAVPEGGTLALMLAGMLTLGVFRRRHG